MQRIPASGRSNARARAPRSRREGGFTLIEILVVAAIVGILAALAVSQVVGARKKARDTRVEADLNEIAKACERLFDDTGYYPLKLPEAVCIYRMGTNEAYVHDVRMGLLKNSATGQYKYENWKGPYLANPATDPSDGVLKILDPWGRPYIYDSDYCLDGVEARVVHSGGPNKSGINVYDADNVVKALCIDPNDSC